MKRSLIFTLVAVLIIILAGGVWFLFKGRVVNPLPLSSGDSISSWSFHNAYAGNADLEAKAREKIAHLASLIGSKDNSDYDTLVSIANEYDLLGDGKSEYDSLTRAVRLNPDHLGLAWANLASLMEHLGAYNTARVAYGKAVEAQRDQMSLYTAQAHFLIEHFPTDTSAITAVFAEANKQFGDAAPLLQIEASWQEKGGHIKEAINDLVRMANLMPEEARVGIEAQIVSLRAKL